MKLLLLCILVIFTRLVQSDVVAKPFIHGGVPARRHDAPYQVSIQVFQWPFISRGRLVSQHSCGGAIITSSAVLTAAHCLYMPTEYMIVKAGLIKLIEQPPDIQTASVRKYIKHYLFDESSKSVLHDIGVVLLKTPFEFNRNVQPIALPRTCQPDVGYVNITGWGWLYSNLPYSSVHLQRGYVPILPLQECARDLDFLTNTQLYSSQLCTKSVKGFGSTCSGDSGGPAVQDGFALGIISFSCADCEMKECPNVYTRICKYNNFIISALEM